MGPEQASFVPACLVSNDLRVETYIEIMSEFCIFFLHFGMNLPGNCISLSNAHPAAAYLFVSELLLTTEINENALGFFNFPSDGQKLL